MQGNAGLTLLNQIQSKQLIAELIQQINKDASLSGTDQRIQHTSDITQLLRQVHGFLVHLMNHDFGAYLNFLYRADVPEEKVRGIDETDPVYIADKVLILVLQREWKKVSLRNKIQ